MGCIDFYCLLRLNSPRWPLLSPICLPKASPRKGTNNLLSFQTQAAATWTLLIFDSILSVSSDLDAAPMFSAGFSYTTSHWPFFPDFLFPPFLENSCLEIPVPLIWHRCTHFNSLNTLKCQTPIYLPGLLPVLQVKNLSITSFSIHHKVYYTYFYYILSPTSAHTYLLIVLSRGEIQLIFLMPEGIRFLVFCVFFFWVFQIHPSQ